MLLVTTGCTGAREGAGRVLCAGGGLTSLLALVGVFGSAMVDTLFVNHNTEATEDEIASLVALLKRDDVKLNSVARFTIALDSHTTVRAFVAEHGLSDVQEKLLVFAAAKAFGSDDSCVAWKVWNLENNPRVREEDHPTGSIRVGAWQPESCSQSSKARKLETAIRKQAVQDPGKALPELAVVAVTKPYTLAEQHARDRATVARLCVQLFHRVGPVGKLYVQLFGNNGSQKPHAALLTMLDDMFFLDKCKEREKNTETVRGYCRNCNVFLEWLECLHIELGSVTIFQVAAFLRDRAPLGKSVPSRYFYALKWFYVTTGVDVHTESAMVQGQALVRRGPIQLASPKPAKCPTTELVIKLERCVCSRDEPVVVRVIAGLLCALTHGCLRWSDAQRTMEITLGRDLIYAKSVMKRKSVLTPWIASRTGFSGEDWGEAWFNAMAALGMPGPDFLLFEPVSVVRVKMVPASYSAVINYMRIVLCRPCVGLSVQEALEFSLHSWRHLYPTMSTQLGLDPSQQEAIGHWKKGSTMPLEYDASTNSLEIRAKQHILSSVRKGFDVSKPGEFLMADPSSDPTRVNVDPCSAVSCDSDLPVVQADEPEPVVPLPADSSSGSGDLGALPICDVVVQDDGPVVEKGSRDQYQISPVQVVDNVNKKVHLYCSGGRTLCNTWKCGPRDKPLLDAKGKVRALFEKHYDCIDIVELESRRVCQLCFSESSTKRFRDNSYGMVDIPCYNDARLKQLEDVSSGDSCLSSYSLVCSEEED